MAGGKSTIASPKLQTMTVQSILPRKMKYVENVYSYVDLGLPSGTLWATCNLGANEPHEPGAYFGTINHRKRAFQILEKCYFCTIINLEKCKKTEIFTLEKCILFTIYACI